MNASGPIPLLAMAVVLSLALFLVYRDVSALRAKLSQLEANVPAVVDRQLAVALSRQQAAAAAALADGGMFGSPMSFADLQDDLQGFVQEATKALDDDAAATAPAALAELEDVTDAAPPSAGEPEVPTVAAKKRAKKTEQ